MEKYRVNVDIDVDLSEIDTETLLENVSDDDLIQELERRGCERDDDNDYSLSDFECLDLVDELKERPCGIEYFIESLEYHVLISAIERSSYFRSIKEDIIKEAKVIQVDEIPGYIQDLDKTKFCQLMCDSFGISRASTSEQIFRHIVQKL